MEPGSPDMPRVEFLKISYDRIFGDRAESYVKANPGCNMNEAFDIIRP